MTALTEKFRRMRELQKAYAYNTYGGRFHEMREAEAEVDRLLAEPAAPQAEPSDDEIMAIGFRHFKPKPDLNERTRSAYIAAVRECLALRPAPVAEPDDDWGESPLPDPYPTGVEPSDDWASLTKERLRAAITEFRLRKGQAMDIDDFVAAAFPVVERALRPAPFAQDTTGADWQHSIGDLILHLHQWQAAAAGEASTTAWNRLQATINALAAPVAEPAASGAVIWPTMPPSKGQSHVLFDDGYAEGWAKCLSECKAALAASAPPQPVAQGDDEPVAWRYKALPMPDEPWQASTRYESIKNASQIEPLYRAARSNLQVGGDVPEGWKKAVQEAYGWLWHVNNEPMAPVPLWSPEKAAYEARKNLRELLTKEQRGEAINAVAGLLENKIAAAPSSTGSEKP